MIKVNVDHHVMHTQPIFNLATSTNDIMSNNDRIQAALADLESQEVPNYSRTAKEHGVGRTTLMRRFTGKTVSHSAVDNFTRSESTLA